MDYRWQLLSTALVIMLIACPHQCSGQKARKVAVEDEQQQQNSSVSSAGGDGEEQQYYRFLETHHQQHHRLEETSSSSTGVQNNVKINMETSVRHVNEDKVLVHQQQKGQRQKLNKHGNETIINPSLRVSMQRSP